MRDKAQATTRVTSKSFNPLCSPYAPHEEHCRLFIAVNCGVGIRCPHGYDVCPVCDPCTCETPRMTELLRYFRKGHLNETTSAPS